MSTCDVAEDVVARSTTGLKKFLGVFWRSKGLEVSYANDDEYSRSGGAGEVCIS